MFVILATCRRNKAVTGFKGLRPGLFLPHRLFGLHARQRRPQRRRRGRFHLRRARLPIFYSPRPLLRSSRLPDSASDRPAARNTTRLSSINRPTKPHPNQRIANVILQPCMSPRVSITRMGVDSMRSWFQIRRKLVIVGDGQLSAIVQRPRSKPKLQPQVLAARLRYCVRLLLESSPKNM